MPPEGVGVWIVLVLAAMTVGLAKTAIPGIGILPVVLFAAVLPARQSTATLLVLLIVADIIAISLYRAHADWRALRRLLPAVVVGIAIGAVVLTLLDDTLLRRLIGGALAVIALASLIRWRRASSGEATADAADATDSAEGADAAPGADRADETAKIRRPSRVRTWTYGPLAGAMTMIANSAGPVMTIYFLASGMSVRAMLGTLGWFYFIVNVSKLPFSIAIGLVDQNSLLVDLFLLPAVLAGAFVGHVIVRRISRELFELIVYVLTLIAAVWLLLSA